MKKTVKNLFFVSVIISLLVVCFAFSASATKNIVETGKCGDKTNYVLYDNGDLVISGTGEITSTFSWNDEIVNVTIKQGIIGIDSYAFSRCSNLESIIIADSVKEIGGYSFEYCEKLKSVEIGSGVSIIKEGAFLSCENLKNIVIPDNVKKIETRAFEFSGIEHISLSNNLLSISESLFSYCSDLSSISIPNSVTSIEKWAFRETNIESVTIPSNVQSISSGAFAYCDKLTGIKVENENEYFTNDSAGALFNKGKTVLIAYPPANTNITYNIPEGVTEISYGAFIDCTYLTDINIPDSVSKIGEYAFYHCAKLTNITIPFGVTKINNHTFDSCYSFTSVTIPNSVTSIGNFAFCNTNLSSIFIPSSVTTIGYLVFGGCSNLADITVDENNTQFSSDEFGVLFNKNKTSLIYYPIGNQRETYTISEVVINIGDNAFSGSPFVSIVIPQSVKKIGELAFYGCDNLIDVYYTGSETNWKNISIKSSNNELCSANIHYYYGCEHDEIIVIPEEKATCTEYGLTEGRYCNICGETLVEQEDIEPLNHSLYWYHTDSMGTDAYDLMCSICDESFGRSYLYSDGLYHMFGYIEDGECYHYVYDENGINLGSEKCEIAKWYSDEEYHEGICKCHVIMCEGEHFDYIESFAQPATLTENGLIETICTLCGEIIDSETIYYPKTITLSSTSVTYNGKTRSPSVTVKDSKGNTLKNGTDYTVTTPSGRKAPGQYTYTIKFKGNYEGTKTLKFTILPKAPAISDISATQSTSVINLKWKASAGATGYRIYQYSSSKKAYVQIASVKTTSYRKATNLKPGTEYKFKVKPYTKLSDGTVLFGTASEAFATATECKAPSIKSVISPSKAKATVKWSDVDGETGYQLYYSTKKDSGFKKIDSYSANKLTASKAFSASASGKTIYFKVRAYKKVGGQTIYSDWSALKSVKLK